jgi:hypothetical protein
MQASPTVDAAESAVGLAVREEHTEAAAEHVEREAVVGEEDACAGEEEARAATRMVAEVAEELLMGLGEAGVSDF